MFILYKKKKVIKTMKKFTGLKIINDLNIKRAYVSISFLVGSAYFEDTLNFTHAASTFTYGKPSREFIQILAHVESKMINFDIVDVNGSLIDFKQKTLTMIKHNENRSNVYLCRTIGGDELLENDLLKTSKELNIHVAELDTIALVT